MKLQRHNPVVHGDAVVSMEEDDSGNWIDADELDLRARMRAAWHEIMWLEEESDWLNWVEEFLEK